MTVRCSFHPDSQHNTDTFQSNTGASQSITGAFQSNTGAFDQVPSLDSPGYDRRGGFQAPRRRPSFNTTTPASRSPIATHDAAEDDQQAGNACAAPTTFGSYGSDGDL